MPSNILSLLIGLVAGSRTLTAPAAMSWAAHSGRLLLRGTPLSFLGQRRTRALLTVLAAGEMLTDKLPQTPSRTVPLQFCGRLVSGGLCGAAIESARGSPAAGLVAGVLGAAVGTLGGYAVRRSLSRSLGMDPPAALIEDAAAIGGAILIVRALR